MLTTFSGQENCVLCSTAAGQLIVQSSLWRIVRATDELRFPLTYRLIWNRHVMEFSDLDKHERHLCTDILVWLEKAMRQFLEPDKINLASLGNMVPHLHWHVISRYQWDSTFPASIWAPAVRDVEDKKWALLRERQQALEACLAENNRCLG